MFRLSLALMLLLIPGGCGRSVIAEREAVAKIEDWGSQRCTPIPVGTHKTLPPALMSDQERALALSALAFEKASVVTVDSVGNLIENILTVQLRPDFDKVNLNANVNGLCLLESSGLKISKVTKIEGAEGGTSIKWNASIVYVLYEYNPNPFAERYHQAMQSAGGYGKRKGVYLFRQEAFNQQWTLIALDAADASAPSFEAANVAQRLRGD